MNNTLAVYYNMPVICDESTQLIIGDPGAQSLSLGNLPEKAEIEAAFQTLICSSSGWRKIFALDGDAHSSLAAISRADHYLVATAAMVLAQYINSYVKKAPTILVGIDSRTTGPIIAETMIRIFAGSGLHVHYLFLVPIPQLIAYSTTCAALTESDPEKCDFFCYISASHNPLGYNGIKFGWAGQGVLGGAEAAKIIARYTQCLFQDKTAAQLLQSMEGVAEATMADIFLGCPHWKSKSIVAYNNLLHRVLTGRESAVEQKKIHDILLRNNKEKKLAVVAELNGSARTCSLDKDFIQQLGLSWYGVNDNARDFDHTILPEGPALDRAKQELLATWHKNPGACLAYTPDCDGDRGNIVYINTTGIKPEAKQLEAQEIFAISCIAELAMLRFSDELFTTSSHKKVAVVINDATSLRINRIAQAFAAEVFRTETGEANLVCKAAALCEAGYLIRIIGEGSNGGNITHPAQVRDPLATLGAIIKLLSIHPTQPTGLFAIWQRQSGQNIHQNSIKRNLQLDDIITSLPSFHTTATYEDRSILHLKTSEMSSLKMHFQKIFLSDWDLHKINLYKRFGINSWTAHASVGQEEINVQDNFGQYQGGLRIQFMDQEGQAKAFIWLRKSGTEPVLRILSDIEGAKEDEEYLHEWLRTMVQRADTIAH